MVTLRLKFIILLFVVSFGIKAQALSSDNVHGGVENGLVGKIDDEQEVTLNGQFHYEIPISTVSGSGGMTPQLSISYNSSNGNGLCGFGFDLTGLSVISRAPENLFRDGDADVVRFDDTDRFSLDGVRLSLVRSTSSYREYRLETNNFSKIIAEGNAVDPSKFIVYTKDGIIHEYTSAKLLMNNASSRIVAGQSRNLYWLETKVTDTKGNFFKITYDGDVENNDFHPVSIDYTGNSNASLSPYSSIKFTYTTLLDNYRRPAYVSGVKSRIGYTLNWIKCYSGDILVKKYGLDYSLQNGNFYLSKITEYMGSEKKNPTTFSWNNNGSFNVDMSVSSTDANFKNTYMVIGDFNGDGLSDILTRVNNNKLDLNYKIYINNGKTFNSPILGTFLLPENANPDNRRIDEVKTGDFNGDGYDDIIVERANSPFYSIDLYFSHVDANGNFNIEYEKTIIRSIYFEHTMTVMDANCDGAADLFVRNKNYASNTYFTLLSQSSENGVNALAQQFEGELPDDNWYGNVILVDLDGDGTSEVLNVHETSLSVLYLMQPTGELKKEKAFSLSGTDYFSVGDFNGDGKTDIMTTGSTKDSSVGWEMNFSTGLAGKDENTFDYTTISNLFSSKDKQIYVVDINGDGYDDFYAVDRKTVNNQKKPVDIYLNDRSGTSFIHYTGANVYGSDKRSFQFADFNGDGKMDFICYPKIKDATPGYDLYTVENSDNNLLTAITDGMGCTTRIEYKRLTDKTVHTRGTRTDYPVVSVNCPWSVVSRLSVPDGLGGQRTMDYKYNNLLIHKRGRGVLCFENVIVKDNSTGIETVSTFEILGGEMVPALKSKKTSVNGKMLKDIEYTNILTYQLNTSPKEVSFTCLPVKTVESSYEYNSGVITSEVITDVENDNYGNATKVTVTSGDNVVTTENTYLNNEDNWILGRLIKSVVTKSRSGESVVLSSEFAYDATSGLLVSESFEPGNDNGYVKTYLYDEFGNVVESTIVSNDKAYQPRTTKTEYSNDGRFKIKSVNSLGFISTSTIDSGLGVETSSTDINGLTTTYEHDAFGRVTKIISPLKTTTITTAWSNGHQYAPANSVYYVKTESTGTPTQWEFFDCLGRTLRKANMGLNDKIIYTDVEYNTKGQVARTSAPYFRGETAYWNITEYDAAGRVVKKVDTNGQITSIDYSGLTTKVTDPLGNVSSKIYDFNGLLVTSVDAKGNMVTYKYDVSGNCVEAKGPSTTVLNEYDKLGNKTKMTDPDLGIIEYGYNSFGELVWQKNAKGIINYEYDVAGRIVKETRPDMEVVTYYDGGYKGKVDCITTYQEPTVLKSYQYDNYGRIIKDIYSVGRTSFVTELSYNDNGQVDVITYPTGLEIKNHYAPNGTHISVSNNKTGKYYWQLSELNARGQVNKETYGNNLVTTNTFDEKTGRLTAVSTPGIQNWTYGFDAVGNLLSRRDLNRNLNETFEYDELYRLTNVRKNGLLTQSVTYDAAGNILYKSDVGQYDYEDGTNKLISLTGNVEPMAWDDIRYNSFDKITYIRSGEKEMTLAYGGDGERAMQEIGTKRKYYVGTYFEEVVDEESREVTNFNYIYGLDKVVAVVEDSPEQGIISTKYVHCDHLGSIQAYSNESGTLYEELSYDAWGCRRDPRNWIKYTNIIDANSWLDKGFGGHDHLDVFEMVNMDGRMYDPVVGRFMSPDPYVQMPDFTQSMNRYAYCVNNPLSLVDPTGYSWIGDTFAALVGIAVGLETGGLASGISGALIGGALGGASASLMGSVINGANLWQTAKSTFTGAFWGAAGGVLNFEIGNIEYTFSRIAAHSLSEGVMEGIRGGHFEHGLLVGLVSSSGGALISHYGSNLSYAERIGANILLGGIVSELGGGKFANGAMTAAYIMMFNDLKHRGLYYRQLKKVKKFYDDIKKIYDDSPEFYESLGGEIAAYAAEHPEWFINSCAARLSQALNECGILIPEISGKTMKGAGDKNYFLRAADMKDYFLQIWGEPRFVHKSYTILNGIVFQSGFDEVSGHVDVFSDKSSGGLAKKYHTEIENYGSIKTVIWKYGR